MSYNSAIELATLVNLTGYSELCGCTGVREGGICYVTIATNPRQTPHAAPIHAATTQYVRIWAIGIPAIDSRVLIIQVRQVRGERVRHFGHKRLICVVIVALFRSTPLYRTRESHSFSDFFELKSLWCIQKTWDS